MTNAETMAKLLMDVSRDVDKLVSDTGTLTDFLDCLSEKYYARDHKPPKGESIGFFSLYVSEAATILLRTYFHIKAVAITFLKLSRALYYIADVTWNDKFRVARAEFNAKLRYGGRK